MENLLQIEIFNKKVHYVVKSQKFVDKNIIINSIRNVVNYLLAEINQNIIIQIVCSFDSFGVVVDVKMPAVITIIDPKKRKQKSLHAFSVRDMQKQIMEYVNIKCNIMQKTEAEIDVYQFNNLVLSKDFMNKIILLTQQYFFEKKVKIKSTLTLQVETNIGKEMIIENGNSKKVSVPILSVSEWRGVKRGTIKENNYLFAKDLNNFLSAVNFETNEYFFSISVSKGIDTNMLDTIYVRRNIDSFWEQLQEVSIDGEKFLCMSK